METLPTLSQPEAGAESDREIFHRLAMLAAQTEAVEPLLAFLAEALDLPALSISAPKSPHEREPSDPGPLSVPIRYRERHLGDLCAPVAPDADTADLGARLAFFGPIIALQMAISMRSEDDTASLAPSDRQAWDLRDERDRLEAVLDATNDAILLVDTHDTLVMATPQFETFTGISRYDILGLPVEQVRSRTGDQPGLPRVMLNVIRALAGNYTESLAGEFELTEPQRRTLVWYSLPVYVRRGTLLGRIYVFRDATRERELDRMKTDFISLVSHELRTPLTSVKGFCDLLIEGAASQLDAESREYLEIIAFNADRLIALINDILDITRIDSDRIELKPEACSIGDAVAEAVKALGIMLKQRGHTLTLDVPSDLPPVWADRSRLAQILAHLLTNASKYTLEPGHITVQARAVQSGDDLPPAAPRAQIVPCVVVSVQDTGIGIAPDNSERIFERFFRVDGYPNRGISGTGLGLAIVKSLVELQGGRVWFESVVERGSTFSFSIPLAHIGHLQGY